LIEGLLMSRPTYLIAMWLLFALIDRSAGPFFLFNSNDPQGLLIAQEQLKEVPHNQDTAPNDPRSPEEAIAAMTVPEGFTVELVASEPELINPVSMTFDHRGRIWVTESMEYPRREPGPGKDRIKILEDTDGDGKVDSVKIFAEGLNIPSGIAVGYGGVWVANSPDILFLQDTDGDDKADKTEVIVTGFGRFDTHELPNSLTWGPDGYLYGLNGVFNYANVQQDGKQHKFTCAMFRIDPQTRKFELFAEGTSNPWGITFDNRGEAFISACVIDHLWHISESGYYLRQAGAYPSHTWIIDSIVDHKHFKAAYCGIEYFDSEAYPTQYRNKLYMGNIHGGSINADEIQRFGSTYKASENLDLLKANDVWFMPVAQKIGPDGCLYVLDWYDRYHCYQDANRDPAGIDRLKGRLYRIRYKDTPRKVGFNLADDSDQKLITLLDDGNLYFRNQSQQLLAQRIANSTISASGLAALTASAISETTSERARRHAVWALSGGQKLDATTWGVLTQSKDPVVRAHAVRMAGNLATSRNQELADQWNAVAVDRVLEMATDPSSEVRLATIVALNKLQSENRIDAMLQAANIEPLDDGLLPRILWQNLFPSIQADAKLAERLVRNPNFIQNHFAKDLAPRLAGLLLEQDQLQSVLELADALADRREDSFGTRQVLQAVEQKLLSGEISFATWRQQAATLAAITQANAHIPELDRLRAFAGDQQAITNLATTFQNASNDGQLRKAAFSALCFIVAKSDSADVQSLDLCLGLAKSELESQASPEVSNHVIDQLVRLSSPKVAQVLLDVSDKIPASARTRIVESLTSRPSWAKVLFAAMGENDRSIPRDAVNQTQILRLLDSGDEQLLALIQQKWGTVQVGQRGLKVDEMTRVRRVLRQIPGDTKRGWLVYDRVCGQCHQLAGRGEEVGPGLDANGRASLSQLLSNMVDPNLVIGKDYQARMVATVDGRIFSGLVVEENQQRITLNIQGGKRVTIPRDEIDEEKISPNSLMPEGQTQQMTQQEIADLLALLTLVDPKDESGGKIPESELRKQTQWSVNGYASILPEVFAEFSTDQQFEGGLSLIDQHQARVAVIRTHPVDQATPTVLRRKVKLPAAGKVHLLLGVSHHQEGDWQLIVKANRKTLKDILVSPESCQDGWLDLSIDLSEFAGQEVLLELENRANDYAFEFAFWSHAYLQSSTD